MNELLHTPSLDEGPTMKPAGPHRSTPGVLSLHQLLEHHPAPEPALIEPGLLPSSGILFLGGEPKLGKSILAANLALALASGCSRLGFQVATPRRVLMCQFELPTSQFAQRLDTMRQPMGSAADSNLFVDTQAAGHLLSTPHGLDHFLGSARAANAEVIVFDPLYSTHGQDENDTRAMSALCQALLRLRDGSGAALILIHHVRKSVGRHEIGSAFRGSSALHAVGDSYLLLVRNTNAGLSTRRTGPVRPSPDEATVCQPTSPTRLAVPLAPAAPPATVPQSRTQMRPTLVCPGLVIV